MENIITQIYEVQTPAEAKRLIELGVDHIGSVIVSEDIWKVPLIKKTIENIKKTTSKSSLIPLFKKPEIIFKLLDSSFAPPNMGLRHIITSFTSTL